MDANMTIINSILYYTSCGDLESGLSCLLHRITTGLCCSSDDVMIFCNSFFASSISALFDVLSKTKIYEFKTKKLK